MEALTENFRIFEIVKFNNSQHCEFEGRIFKKVSNALQELEATNMLLVYFASLQWLARETCVKRKKASLFSDIIV